MDINVKLQYAKQHIDNIVSDDEAEVADVIAVLLNLSDYLSMASVHFIDRRNAKAAAREAQAIAMQTAADDGTLA